MAHGTWAGGLRSSPNCGPFPLCQVKGIDFYEGETRHSLRCIVPGIPRLPLEFLGLPLVAEGRKESMQPSIGNENI